MKVIDTRRCLARIMMMPPLRSASWQTSNRVFLATFSGILAALYLCTLLVDPYGVVPFSPPFERPIMTAQRQMYPQILRTGRYDSAVVGTSTIRLLDPVGLDHALGGHFANFALPSETAWEQVQVINFFRRTVAEPQTMLIGIDHVWCYRDTSTFAHEYDAMLEKAFPSWAYDSNRWNDLLYLLNTPTVDSATRTIGHLLINVPARVREDGYEDFAARDAVYDPRAHRIGRGGDLWRYVAELSETARAAMDFPALPWLDAALASLPATTRKLMVFPPVNAQMLPDPGSRRAALEAECRARVAAIARRRGAVLVDWRIPSVIASEDAYFYDLVHYRLSIADRLIDDLGHIVSEGRESPDGSYRILVR